MTKLFEKYNAILAFMLSLFILSTLFHASLFYFQKNMEDAQRLMIVEEGSFFESEVSESLQDNVDLLKGFSAYIETSGQLDDDHAKIFLDNLLRDEITLIRNVSIIDDTTIVWTYPKEGNEKAIGVDLAKVEGQADDLLLVKESLTSISIGPVELVQGGLGVIIRLPIVRDGSYWGQISIVLDWEKYTDKVAILADEYNLKAHIYRMTDTGEVLLFENGQVNSSDAVEFYDVFMASTYRFVIEPENGWNNYSKLMTVARLIAISISFVISLFIMWSIKTKNKMKIIASVDGLTSLENRYSLNQYLDNVLYDDLDFDSILVAIIDIDKFKRINDNYGHHVGDEVLVQFADRLRNLPFKDLRLYRLGGDEFLVILCNEQKLSVESIEAILTKQLSFNYTDQNYSFNVKSSVGCAMFDGKSATIQDLMKRADNKMYEEKKSLKGLR